MNGFTHRAVLIILFALALACYAYGFNAGVTLVIATGVLFETLFWLGIFTVSTEHKDNPK